MRPVVVLDIGSSKIVSLSATRVGNDGLRVYGADIRPYSGFRYKKFNDEADLSQTIEKSLMALASECDFNLNEVAISAPAPFTKIEISTALLKFSSQPKRIIGADIDMLINASLPENPPVDYYLMHSTPFAYKVDGKKVPYITEGMEACKLEAEVSHVYLDGKFFQVVREAIKQAGMRPGVCISASLAQALMIIPEKMRQKPVVLVDVGYTHTDVISICQAAIVAKDTIEAGGMHVSQDLAAGLGVSVSSAEQIKRKYAFSQDYQDSVELLRTSSGTKSVERAFVQHIIEERAKELCYMVRQSISEQGINISTDPPVVYLTGGGLGMMRNSVEFMEKTLKMPVRLDMPWMPRMNSPNYASVFGSLEFILHADTLADMDYDGSMLQRIKELFVK